MRLAGAHASSNLIGQSAAFNATLFFTALFGLLASFTKSFLYSLHCTFLLGKFSWGLNANRWHPFTRAYAERKAVPCNCPFHFFFSFGALLSAVIALLVVPQHSCPSSALVPCEVDIQNQGWKYLLITLTLISLRHPLTSVFT